MTRNILLFGAGKSTAYIIDYLVNRLVKENLALTIVDQDITAIQKSLPTSERIVLKSLDIHNSEARKGLIEKATIVISMLPVRLHYLIAQDCLTFKKHLVTASYVSDELKQLHSNVEQEGLIFLNEVGLDPGIDHMSAMHMLDQIRAEGGKILLFESFTGGLVAPENDDNLWNYKFTWNPRNVVLAGQGGAAKFIQEGTYKYIPYHKLFRRTEFIEIEDYGKFEVYANRDSLWYREAYGLANVLTLYRGTIRRVGFSKAWNFFIQLGLTDDSFTLENSKGMSYRAFLNLFALFSNRFGRAKAPSLFKN